MPITHTLDTGGFQRWLPVNVVAGGAHVAPQVAAPDVYPRIDNRSNRGTLILPFGGVDENDTFTLYIYGGKSIQTGTGQLNPQKIIPALLYTCTVTLGAQLGVSGELVGATDRYAKDIAIVKSTLASTLEGTGVYGKTAVELVYTSGSNDIAAVLILDLFNFNFLMPRLVPAGFVTANLLFSLET